MAQIYDSSRGGFSLCFQLASGPRERRAGELLERLERRAFDSCEGIQDLETPDGVEHLLDHLRTHFEPIEGI